MTSFQIKHYFKLPVKFRNIFYAFLIINIVLMIQDYTYDSIRNPEKSYAFFYNLVWVTSIFFSWLILTPFLYRIAQYFLNKKINLKILFINFSIASLLASLHMVLVMLFRFSLIFFRDWEWYNPFSQQYRPDIIFMTFNSFIQYFALLAVFIALDYYRRYQEKLNELNKAQLSTLKMQLNPHFLFNTLHTISSLMGKNNEGQKVLSRLGELLRSMLEGNQKMTITLQEELNYLKNYLYIEEVRFQDRLSVIYDIESGTENLMVPNLILQPLVENAIKHGFSQNPENGQIKLSSRVKAGKLILSVSDDGMGLNPEKKSNGSGIGLTNVRERLSKMYPGESTFKIEANSDSGCIVEIQIPYQLSKKEGNTDDQNSHS